MEARLQAVTKLEAAAKQVEEAQAAHRSKLDEIALNAGYKTWPALAGALSPQTHKQKEPGKPKRHRAKLDAAKRNAIIEAYKAREKGTTAVDIAKRFGCSVNTVHKLAAK